MNDGQEIAFNETKMLMKYIAIRIQGLGEASQTFVSIADVTAQTMTE
jgi:hypothetical protein